MPELPITDDHFVQMAQYVEAVRTEQQQRADAIKVAQRRLEVSINEQAETAALRQDIRKLMQYYQQHAIREDAFLDMFENLSTRMERIEHGQMLLLMEQLDSPQIRNQANDVVVGHAKSISEQSRRRQLAKRQANLDKLLEQAAEYGSGQAPLDLQNKITAEQDAIQQLRL